MLDYKLFQNPVKHLKWLKAVNAPILIGVFLGEGRGVGVGGERRGLPKIQSIHMYFFHLYMKALIDV